MDNASIRVLVIDENPTSAGDLASFLSAHHYDVSTCSALDGARSAVSSRRPHVLVLATKDHPHAEVEEVRKVYPRLPLVLLTEEAGQELLLDVEAFAPAVPACPARGLGHIESAVEAAAHFS
ncbi:MULTISPECIES: response regulator [Polyangium]|uniref:Response regulator n=1 Tax=Polyangium jinanense TaxID=2829994 RepID=A0A9X3X1Q3_9BACT|nr:MULTISPECIES: response regulator [Polyangium]MDC3954607.1 response regulator [Polyangium jinanense]MDC3980910.1 response regulator [Polyangium jinanense]MDI1477025.1 response regulator [Polyangium sp. y55x31]